MLNKVFVRARAAVVIPRYVNMHEAKCSLLIVWLVVVLFTAFIANICS